MTMIVIFLVAVIIASLVTAVVFLTRTPVSDKTLWKLNYKQPPQDDNKTIEYLMTDKGCLSR